MVSVMVTMYSVMVFDKSVMVSVMVTMYSVMVFDKSVMVGG